MAARNSSEKQRQSSRNNGKKSRGPVTKEGRDTVSRNASFAVMEKKFGLPCPQQDREMGRLLYQLMEDLSPNGVAQTLLVERIALYHWKLRRLGRVETRLLAGDFDPKAAERKYTERQRIMLWQLEQSLKEDGEVAKPLVPPSAEELYLKAFAADSRLLERLQNYELKLQKALQASLRELRRLKKGLGTEESADDDTDDCEASLPGLELIDSPELKNANGQQKKNDRIEPEKSDAKQSKGKAIAGKKREHLPSRRKAVNPFLKNVNECCAKLLAPFGEWFEKASAPAPQAPEANAETHGFDPVLFKQMQEEDAILKARLDEEDRLDREKREKEGWGR